jgi:hypothetical protein
MRGRGFVGLSVVGALAVASPTISYAQEESPEDVAVQYVSAMQAEDWNSVASLMHPAALTELRGLFDPLLDIPEATPVILQFYGVSTLAEARAQSDTAVFANFVAFVSSQDPMVGEAIRSSEVEIVGHLYEGDDLAHVVYRMTMTVEGISVTQLDVFSVKRFGSTWRGMLKGDMSAIAAAIGEAVNGGEE